MMFNHFTFIPEKHHVALAACVRNHMTITANELASTYKAALANLAEYTPCPGKRASHMLTTNEIAIGTATDEKLGVYVQLARVKGQGDPLLTVGVKWVTEDTSAVLGNTSTTFW